MILRDCKCAFWKVIFDSRIHSESTAEKYLINCKNSTLIRPWIKRSNSYRYLSAPLQRKGFVESKIKKIFEIYCLSVRLNPTGIWQIASWHTICIAISCERLGAFWSDTLRGEWLALAIFSLCYHVLVFTYCLDPQLEHFFFLWEQ